MMLPSDMPPLPNGYRLAGKTKRYVDPLILVTDGHVWRPWNMTDLWPMDWKDGRAFAIPKKKSRNVTP